MKLLGIAEIRISIYIYYFRTRQFELLSCGQYIKKPYFFPFRRTNNFLNVSISRPLGLPIFSHRRLALDRIDDQIGVELEYSSHMPPLICLSIDLINLST